MGLLYSLFVFVLLPSFRYIFRSSVNDVNTEGEFNGIFTSDKKVIVL